MGLEERLQDGTAVFAVVGLGYVGLPLATEMARAGNRVIGLDVKKDVVDTINSGRSSIADVPSEKLAPLVSDGLLEATTDFSRVSECDAVAICVPTPLDKAKEPDVSFIVAATEAIAPHLKPQSIVTLESTTYPGTTEEIVQPILEAQGFTIGEDLYLAFSPERVDPGNVTYQTKNTPKVVGGVTPKCAEYAIMFYRRFLDEIVPVSSTRAAEMSKLLENIFRCVNIALVNELLMLCERMDIDIWEVVDAAKTKPFGFMPFYPGPGLGGHCIPIDPFYLAWKAREYDFHTEFIELAGKVNENMPYYVARRLMDALNGRSKALRGSRILLLGVAYKADIDDMRESPAIRVAELLMDKGAEIVYHDPFVKKFIVNGVEVPRCELTPEECEKADAVLVITAHSTVDYDMVLALSDLILDTRNVYAGSDSDRVTKL